jgi:hypothetical protein
LPPSSPPARAAGRHFEQAWPDALEQALTTAGALRPTWLEVLEDTRDAWRAAFDRLPLDAYRDTPEGQARAA